MLIRYSYKLLKIICGISQLRFNITGCLGLDDCCSQLDQCGEGEGDCDSDEDCQGELFTFDQCLQQLEYLYLIFIYFFNKNIF